MLGMDYHQHLHQTEIQEKAYAQQQSPQPKKFNPANLQGGLAGRAVPTPDSPTTMGRLSAALEYLGICESNASQLRLNAFGEGGNDTHPEAQHTLDSIANELVQRLSALSKSMEEFKSRLGL